MKIYTFTVKLFHDKRIVREIEVVENTSLYKVAEAVVDAFSFDFDHCFGFFSNVSDDWRTMADSKQKYELFTDLIEEGESLEPTGAGSVKKTKASDVWRNLGDQMLMLFDYGDDWRFIIELKEIGKRIVKQKYPRVLKRIGRAPRQY